MPKHLAAKRPAGAGRETTASENKLPGSARGVEAVGFTASLVLLGLLLTLVFRGIGWGQHVWLVMHLPVLLGGLILSVPYAAAVGLLIPALTSGFLDFPLAGLAFRWMIELGVSGALTAVVYGFTQQRFRSESFVARHAAGYLAVAGGILGAAVMFVLVAMVDYGFVQPANYLISFFAPSRISYPVSILVLPMLGLKLRQSASAKPSRKPPGQP